MPLRCWLVPGALLIAVACATQPPRAPAEGGSGDDKSVPRHSPEELKRLVLQLLSRSDSERPTEPSTEDWRRLGPGVLETLETLYADPTTLPAQRQRATAAMGHLEDVRASAVLKNIMGDRTADARCRSIAITAFSDREGPAAVETLVPLLTDPDDGVRATTARALGARGGGAAQQGLEAQLEKETDPGVREAIQQSLTKLQP